ncbi:MAG: CRISPR system precrRNA processing endoribonuclease RAMP protein Cas6 [Mucispirillum sp.]|nr:CRISPR system precrRNA processing endoribonuclease RAMP protein Cas6 [Mucispirillum sp.]
MQINYRRIKLTLFFEKKFTVNIPFAYVFRSVLGNQLHYLSCVLKQQTCGVCPLRFKCAYSVLFENPVDKDNIVITGRDKAPSPYIMQAEYYKNTEIDKIDINVIFTGTGVDYISYFLLAVKRAGEKGMFKERIKYEMGYISCINNKYSLEFDFTSLPLEIYTFNEGNEITHKKFNIQLITPFRYKKSGKYESNITINDILLSAKRRVDILSAFYGDKSITPKLTFIENSKIIGSTFSWMDSSRYSRRQDTNMKIGGIIGSILIEADFSQQHLSLLEAAKLFNIGKNVSFGLGHIDYEEI